MKTNLSIKDIAIIILSFIMIALILALGIVANNYRTSKKLTVIWSDKAYEYENKYNELYSAKKTYIMEILDLKEYNKELYDECQSLKDHPIVITKTEMDIKIDTIKTSIYDAFFTNDKIEWKWKANDSIFYSVNGESGVIILDSANKSVYTTIYETKINANMTLDVIDDGKQLSVIAKTNNPYITLSNMESVVIDPSTSPTLKNYFKEKRWGIGPSISAGILFGNGFNSQPIIGYGGCIGLSLHYDVFQW